MAKVKKFNLRDLALSAERSFRTKEIIIPEWDDADVIIREPSIKARMDHQALLDSAGEKELSAIEQTELNIKADVILLIDVLLDKNKEPVFKLSDSDAVFETYGPVHSRILNAAFELTMTAEVAKKKSETP
ncbi:phage tail assembly chaperone [Providencia sp. PROV273]|uniref:phage tail assembly chaperone n=1 Tax=Providencia sp. PROV273 TaxID=2949960 RepID=UPI002349B614|nr:phage tail assembly chaperone [Providencia sp. PROV273]